MSLNEVNFSADHALTVYHPDLRQYLQAIEDAVISGDAIGAVKSQEARVQAHKLARDGVANDTLAKQGQPEGVSAPEHDVSQQDMAGSEPSASGLNVNA